MRQCQVQGQAPPRNAEAEAHIRQQVNGLPTARYYMAQAILVQEQALANMQTRVQELERQLADRPASGGFLSGLFSGGAARGGATGGELISAIRRGLQTGRGRLGYGRKLRLSSGLGARRLCAATWPVRPSCCVSSRSCSGSWKGTCSCPGRGGGGSELSCRREQAGSIGERG
jgi:Uncharacterized protein conserved in bacteria (DUF2076)